MRLDKFLSDTGTASRGEAKKSAKIGGITVDGAVVSDTSVHIDPEHSKVIYMGSPVLYRKFIYIMMNKPAGILSATEDRNARTVIDLLGDTEKKRGLFPCGRLDRDTVGFLLLTDDGELAHALLSPKKHVKKTYLFECSEPVSDKDRRLLENGVDIGEKRSTLPASVEMLGDKSGYITVCEGKYHQIKRMFSAISNGIVSLERVSFAGIGLDRGLKRGEWRYLTDDEISTLIQKK